MSDNPLPYPPEPIETERERIRRETATRFAAVMIAADVDYKVEVSQITKLAIQQTDHLLDELDRTNRMHRQEAALQERR